MVRTQIRGELLRDSRGKRDDFRSDRAEFRLGRADSWSEIADLRPEKTDFKLHRLDLRSQKAGGTMYGLTDIRHGSPLCSIQHRPFGAAAQKE